MTHYKGDIHQWLHLHLQSTHNEQSLPFNAVALIFLFKDKIFHHSHLQCQLCLLDYNEHDNLQKMASSLSTPHLDRLFIQWNNAVYKMNYWVHTAGRFRVTSVLGRVPATFLPAIRWRK